MEGRKTQVSVVIFEKNNAEIAIETIRLFQLLLKSCNKRLIVRREDK